MQPATRIKISVMLVAIGTILAVTASLASVSSSTIQADGIVIDYGDYDTVWTDANVSEYDSVYDLMVYACDTNGLSFSVDENGFISELNGVVSGEDSFWGAWGIKSGSADWVKIDSIESTKPSDFTIVSISYTESDGEPTVAIDYSGTPIYGYARKYRTVSLSPTITEIVASIKADTTLVGVDSYSNYPKSIVQGVSDGSITVTGTYTSPNYETILGTNPDLVFCDGSQRSHYLVADMLRESEIDAVVLYPGEDLNSIRNNIFIAGKVMQYDMASEEVINNLDTVMEELTDAIATPETKCPNVMVSLDPAVSPWVSGTDTYVDSILNELYAENVFDNWSGWVHITGDMVAKCNPQVIIVITSQYHATQDEYDYMFSHLAEQWKSTDAWKNGKVYMICDGAAEMAQRFGPRTPQFAEIVCRIIHSECFSEEFPLFIGDDYSNYLTFSKEMNYD